VTRGKAPAAAQSAATVGSAPTVAAGVRSSRRRRLAYAMGALAAAAMLAIAGGTVASVAETQSAWTDVTYASAAVTSGTWSTTGTCTAMNSANVAVGSCSIASMTYDGWGEQNKHLRNMYITFKVTDQSTSYIVFTVDLSQAKVGTDSSVGAWNWPTAVTLPSSQMTPTSACSALPKLSGRTVSGWNWTTSSTIYFQMADSPSAYSGKAGCS